MPSAIGVMFVLYILVSIVTGIVSSVIKKSQTTARRPRPVYVPGRQIPYPAELDLTTWKSGSVLRLRTVVRRVGTATEHLAQTDVSDYYSGSTKLEDHSGSADRPAFTYGRSEASDPRAKAERSMRALSWRKNPHSRLGSCPATGSSSGP